jgi:hypothetical protein
VTQTHFAYRLLVVHPLSCCGIWHDGDPGAARGAVPPFAAPEEGVLRSCTQLNSLLRLDLGEEAS